MKYLCLVYAEEPRIDALSDEEWKGVVDENLALCEDLRQSGHFVSAAPLDSVTTAVTVRRRQGKLSATDGPFAETKEQLGGYYLIEARTSRRPSRWRVGSREPASAASRSGPSGPTTPGSPGLAGARIRPADAKRPEAGGRTASGPPTPHASRA